MTEHITQSPEDAITQACEHVRQTLKHITENEEWKYHMLGKVGSINSLAKEFLEEVAKECGQVKNGEKLYKDYPRLRRIKLPSDPNDRFRPKRKKGFIDKQHAIEHQLTIEVREFLHDTQESSLFAKQPIPEDKKQMVIASLRQLVEVMDDHGIFLNQLKGFASKTTMPQDPEPVAEGWMSRFEPGIFTKLNLARGDEKKSKGRE